VQISAAVRGSRRSAGVSQRGLAAAAGVSVGTVAGWERGTDGHERLERAVATCGQRLVPVAVGEGDPGARMAAVQWHQRTSLVERLVLATGVPELTRLEMLALQHARLLLHGRLARALWLPGRASPARGQVVSGGEVTRVGLPPDAWATSLPLWPTYPRGLRVAHPRALLHQGWDGDLVLAAEALEALLDDDGRLLVPHRDPGWHRRGERYDWPEHIETHPRGYVWPEGVLSTGEARATRPLRWLERQPRREPREPPTCIADLPGPAVPSPAPRPAGLSQGGRERPARRRRRARRVRGRTSAA